MNYKHIKKNLKIFIKCAGKQSKRSGEMRTIQDIQAANDLWFLRHSQNKKCQICNIYTAPLWRKHAQYHMLCNRCGIKIKKTLKSKI